MKQMTDTDTQLKALKAQIEHHREKADRLRKRAEVEDRLADCKVKLAAELKTPFLLKGEI